uniref:Uncharacterized protein n=1 Tax=viral metagenome TaxID=1070528 RepID=A0A6C0F679_9ZZZZ
MRKTVRSKRRRRTRRKTIQNKYNRGNTSKGKLYLSSRNTKKANKSTKKKNHKKLMKLMKGGSTIESYIEEGEIHKGIFDMINSEKTVVRNEDTIPWFEYFLDKICEGIPLESSPSGSIGYYPVVFGKKKDDVDTDTDTVGCMRLGDEFSAEIEEMKVDEYERYKDFFLKGKPYAVTWFRRDDTYTPDMDIDMDIDIQNKNLYLNTVKGYFNSIKEESGDGDMGCCTTAALIYFTFIDITYNLESVFPLASIFIDPSVNGPYINLNEETRLDPSILNTVLNTIKTEFEEDGTDQYCMYIGITVGTDSHYFTLTMTKDKTYIYSKARPEGLFDSTGYLSKGVLCNETIQLLDFLLKIFDKEGKIIDMWGNPEVLSPTEIDFIDSLFISPFKVEKCTGETIGIYRVTHLDPSSTPS